MATETQIRMIDVTNKNPTLRQAVAQAIIRMKPETLRLIKTNKIFKGNVLTTAQLAGIMGAKKVPQLIPLTHPINITHCKIDLIFIKAGIKIISTVKTKAVTGVEMEALTAVSLAALTIYDMCKPHDKTMVIDEICLLKKSGGKTGEWKKQ